MTSPQQTATILKQILGTNGLDPLREPQRLRGLLTDQATQQPRREREVLVHTVNSPIFERAWQAGSGSLEGLAQWLADEHGYAADLCQWAVETWALTLGLPLKTPVGTRETTRATTKQRAAESDRGTRPIIDSAARKMANPSPEILIARLQDKNLSHQQRLEIGEALAKMGDPRPGVGLRADGLPDIVWISIPGGQVRVDLETPNSFIRFTEMGTFRSKLDVAPFRIAKYAVTNAQFEVFLTASDGYHNRGWWKDINYPPDHPGWHHDPSRYNPSLAGSKGSNQPREINWDGAVAFCRWLSVKTGTRIRLPTEWEWQRAATVDDPTSTYPWGNEWDSTRCNSQESGLHQTTAVGLYPAGTTPQGLHDMAGNVREWCLNRSNEAKRPEAVSISGGDGRMTRGGCWVAPHYRHIPVAERFYEARTGYTCTCGFRLVRDI